MKKGFKILSIIATVVLSVSVFSGCNKNGINIGIIQNNNHVALDTSREGFIKGLNDRGYVDGENIKIDLKNAQSDQSNLKTISQKFVTDKKDLILAIGTPAAVSMKAETNDIPIVVTAVTDPAASNLVKSNRKPDTNVTGTSDLNPVDKQFELLKQILPDAKTVALLYSSGEQNSIIQADMAEEVAKSMDISTERRTISTTADVNQVVTSLVGKVDAIYIPTDNNLAASMPMVAGIAIPNKIPVIVGEKGMCENGGLATVGVDYFQLGYKAGEMAADILDGKSKPQDMAIQYAPNPELVINKKFADQINLTISDDLLNQAVIIGENENTKESTQSTN